MTEAALQAAILLRFGSNSQIRLWRSQPIVARSASGRAIRALPVGFPDLSGITSMGRCIAIECKTAMGRVSPAQEKFLAMLRKFNALTIVARSVDDVADALRAAGVV